MSEKRRMRSVAILVAVGSFSFALGGGVAALAARVAAPTTATPPILSGPLSSYKAPATYPGAGTDAFESIAEVGIQPGCSGQVLMGGAAGPTVVKRAAPGDKDGDGRADIQTEMLSLDLSGYVPHVGPIQVRESATQASTGQVEALRVGGTFPANSFFDVFFEIDVPSLGTLHNPTAARMRNGQILTLPPFGSEYVGSGQPIQLMNSQNTVVACLVELSHVPEDPSHILIKRELFGIEQRLDEIATKVGA